MKERDRWRERDRGWGGGKEKITSEAHPSSQSKAVKESITNIP
jgi:hypothetical protein